jgi:hypothetical protein
LLTTARAAVALLAFQSNLGGLRMAGTVISRIALRVTGGKFISFQPDGSIAVRDNPNSPGQPGAFETIEVLLLDGGFPVLPNPGPPVVPTPPGPVTPGAPRDRFMSLVAGKPFGQQTLLDLEPTLNAMGWLLTPPNAAGERTKVHPPGGPWTRVGFGEGQWVWKPQAEQ